MTVELKPETEQLVRDEILRGHFKSVDEVIERAVYALREKLDLAPAPPREPRKNLADFLLDSPFAGSELDFERQQDGGRPVDL